MVAQLIEQLELAERRVSIRPSRLLGRYVRGDFWVEYDAPLGLAKLPREIVLLPFVYNIAPIVWASGRSFAVETLDERVLASLEEVRAILCRWYPTIQWSGSITAHRTVRLTAPGDPPPMGEQYEAATLFSGGLDSVSTVMRHRAERQLLVLVGGADLDLSNRAGWDNARRQAEDFAEDYGYRLTSLRSSLRSFADYERLNALLPGRSNWWGAVQHGIGLLSLVAPAAWEYGISRVYIASTYPADRLVPWGSHPQIDERVWLGGARVVHDGAELNRQAKLEQLVAISGELEAGPPALRVCYEDRHGTGRNCERCEKCLRTITALVVVGADPLRFGFPGYSPASLARVPALFESFRTPADAHAHERWLNIQQAAARYADRPRGPAELRLVEWLRSFDFAAYSRRRMARLDRRHQLRRALGARLPRLARAARSIRLAARRAGSSISSRR